MKELPLNAIRAFAAVLETGGGRPAARRLDVTHSSVSRYLRELERWLGAPLFEAREGRRTLHLTPQGKAFGESASQSLAQLGKAAALVREGRRRNSVRLNTSPSVASRWVLPRLSLFAIAHPNIELSIITEQATANPTAADADFFIRMGSGPWDNVVATPLMDDALYPVVNPAYWETNGRPSRLTDLGRLRLLNDRDPQTSWTAWMSIHGPMDLDVRSGPRLTSSDLLVDAAKRGAGVALARHRLVGEEISSGALLRPFGDLKVVIRNAYWMLTPKGCSTSVAAEQTMAWFGNAASKLDAVNGPTLLFPRAKS